MRGGDIEAIGELAGDTLAAGCGLVEQMHQGIASRPFGILGRAARPVQVVHDGVAKAVYGGVRESLRLFPRFAGAVAATGAREEDAALATTPAGSLMLAALNGLRGNHLTEGGSGLALRMQIRRDGSEVPPTPEELTAAFPDATVRVAVFVHGLFETDESWRHFPLRADRSRRRTYGERLQDEFSFTPVYVRYNTGLPVADNGRELAAMLDDLVSGWPLPVAELVLVGHSTGGLVVRRACNYAEHDNRRWGDALRHVFCLGSPHLEIEVEKGINVLGGVLERLPETRALASLLDARSAGIKALDHDHWVEQDRWHGEVHPLRHPGRREMLPFLSQANYYFIAASLTRGPFGRLGNDILNLDLLNHAIVYEQIRTLISRGPTRPTLPPMADDCVGDGRATIPLVAKWQGE